MKSESRKQSRKKWRQRSVRRNGKMTKGNRTRKWRQKTLKRPEENLENEQVLAEKKLPLQEFSEDAATQTRVS